ncbi:acetate uptake transporter [uncultured Ferrimonas sp.]|uniref:acetate uptake transporter n=1 Tax=uncultured Ferrimonas sp. TaxID=432640 RepID=UPI002631E0B2|nr:acetate uptake transporter [uncultured Ferrimonas sp.]
MSQKVANAGPLGLMGFGMTTVLLNIHNAGFFPVDTMILGMGIFFGGIAQIIAGIIESKNGNTFGTTAFISYGSFWLTLVGLWVMPSMNLGFSASSPEFMGCYLAMWGLFTGFMFIGTLANFPRVKQFIFLSLTVLFFLLAIKDFTGNKMIGVIAGYEGIICGFSAIYLAMATIINGEFGRVILPVGELKK